jgi:hypothetical protein
MDSSFSNKWRTTLLTKQAQAMRQRNADKSCYLFKKIKQHLFLVEPENATSFPESSVSLGGLPRIISMQGRKYGAEFLMKIEVDSTRSR